MIKCYCGFKWDADAIIKGFKVDDLGEFFRCPVAPDDYDGWNSCVGHINPETGFWQYFEPLKELYDEIKSARTIKKIRSKHKYLITEWL